MRIRSCFLLALLLGWGRCLSADVLYGVTALSGVPGLSFGVPSIYDRYGINNAWQVTGQSYTATGDHAFLYSNGEMVDLAHLSPARCVQHRKIHTNAATALTILCRGEEAI